MSQEVVNLKLSALTHLEFGELMTRTHSDLGNNLPPLGPKEPTHFQNFLDTLTSQMPAYQKAILQTQTHVLTKDIVAADENRDNAVRTFKKAVKLASLSNILAEAQAAHQLTVFLKSYSRVEKKGYEPETFALDKMVAELESTHAAHVATLGIGRYVAQVKAANADFVRLTDNKSSSLPLQDAYNTKELRQALSKTYLDFVQYVQVMASLPNEGHFVQALAIINKYRKQYADILARRKGIIEAQEARAATPAPGAN
jgi:hypothetical protein